MTAVAWYWACWIIIGFCIPEGIALLRRRSQDTLSDTIWRWCEVTPGSTLGSWTLIHIAFSFFMIWLFGHMVFGWWHKL